MRRRVQESSGREREKDHPKERREGEEADTETREERREKEKKRRKDTQEGLRREGALEREIERQRL